MIMTIDIYFMGSETLPSTCHTTTTNIQVATISSGYNNAAAKLRDQQQRYNDSDSDAETERQRQNCNGSSVTTEELTARQLPQV